MKPTFNTSLLACVGAAVLAATGAHAGSLDAPELELPVAAAVTTGAAVDPFTGFSGYVGLSSISNSFDIDIATTISTDSNALNLPDLAAEGVGLTIGGGYDWAVADKVSVGGFADYTATSAENLYRGTTQFNGFTTGTEVTLKQTYAATLGARIGYVLSSETMLFGLAGYTVAGFDGQASLSATDGQDSVGGSVGTDFMNQGLTLGLGLETRVAEASFLRIEYRQTNFKEYDLFSIGNYGDPQTGGMIGRADHSLKTFSVSFVRRF